MNGITAPVVIVVVVGSIDSDFDTSTVMFLRLIWSNEDHYSRAI
jgi:hypothetical protein